MKGVIMAGGKGTRLRPLTCNIPKPMVPLIHKPVMEYSIDLLKKYGITEIAVTLQYLPEVIKDYFGDGSKFGVKLHYFEETQPLGTAGSIKNAESFLDETFVVISGDALTDFDLQKGIDYHNEKGSLTTIFMKQVDCPLEYGVIMINEDGEIIRFLEKPSWNEVFSDTVNTGIYIIEPEVFQYLEKDIATDFSKDLFPLLMKDKKPLFGFHAEGYWSDVGGLASYRQTQFDMLDKKVNCILPGKELSEGIWVGNNVVIEEGVSLKGPLSIGNEAVIRTACKVNEYSVVGDHSILSTNASLKRSIVWNDVYVGDESELRGTTICKGTRLEHSVSLYESSVIGEHCEIAANAVIKPEVKVWPNKGIEQSATVHTSLIWGKKVTKSLFNGRSVNGLANVEITPDFVGKLASAYGATLSQGAKVFIGSDSDSFTKLIKVAFEAGLHSAGINTVDIGSTISPILRYTLEEERALGGVYFRFANRDREKKIHLEFYDDRGFHIDADTQRKIENAFWQEDYRRAAFDRIGKGSVSRTAAEKYLNRLQKLVDVDRIKKANLKVVIDYELSKHFSFIKKLLETFNCEIFTVPHKKEPEQIVKYVRATDSDIGIIIGETGEFLRLVTEEGSVIEYDTLLALFIMLRFYKGKETSMAIPYYGSSELDLLAKRLGGSLIRTKTNPRSIMKVEGGVLNYLFDAQYAFIHVLEMLAIQEMPLSKIIKLLPNIHLLREYVHCPVNAKGQVMRMLMQENCKSNIELLDGIKVNHPDGGWTLILPDNEKPIFTIYSQAKNLDIAKKFSTNFVEKIRNYQTFGS
ncbi:MAG: NTP transferase domain-containing protein [Bacillaceae bacterium]|nr:NTP transferase domain-containing protein [Bacillaceae bacterium]